MTELRHPPLLILGGLLGYRLACDTAQGPKTVWTLEHPIEQIGDLQLDHSKGRPQAAPGRPELYPAELESMIFGPLLQHFSQGDAARELLIPLADWRISARDQLSRLAAGLSQGGQLDVLTHSWGVHLLLVLLAEGALPLDRIRRLALVTPPFGGSLDALVALRCGVDRINVGSGRDLGWLMRGLPALFDLLPDPEYALVRNTHGDTLDLLAESCWPASMRTSLRPLLMAADEFRRIRRRQWQRVLPQIADRCLLVSGQGAPTAMELVLPAGEIVWDCDPSFLRTATGGDGRLPLAATRPLAVELRTITLGNLEFPVCHGEIFHRPEVPEMLESWLDNSEITLA